MPLLSTMIFKYYGSTIEPLDIRNGDMITESRILILWKEKKTFIVFLFAIELLLADLRLYNEFEHGNNTHALQMCDVNHWIVQSDRRCWFTSKFSFDSTVFKPLVFLMLPSYRSFFWINQMSIHITLEALFYKTSNHFHWWFLLVRLAYADEHLGS